MSTEQTAKTWMVIKPSANKEARKKENEYIDKQAAELGYAIAYASGHVFDIDTLENLEKTVQFFAEQDARCGAKSASDLIIMPVEEVHWKTRRSIMIRKVEDRLNSDHSIFDKVKE
jgi:hypothetical protein